MESCNLVNTTFECLLELRKSIKCGNVDPMYLKSWLEASDISFAQDRIFFMALDWLVDIWKHHIIHILMAPRGILHYIKDILDDGLFYFCLHDFKLLDYFYSDWGRDLDVMSSL